jgi:ATP-dependent exoDNAse (exonuclease V) beta subunit
MTAYVVTCHKMQGGECPVVVVILHESHRAMLYREWLYTAVTRASEKCIVLFKEDALRTALNKQKMPGKTLKQKIISFNEAQGITIDGVQMGKEVRLPHSQSTRNKILERVDEAVTTPARLTTQAELKGGLASLLKKKQERAEPRPEPEMTHKVEVKHTFTFKHVHESAPPPPPPTRREPVDGGDLTPERKTEAEIQPEALPTPTAPQLPPATRCSESALGRSCVGADARPRE